MATSIVLVDDHSLLRSGLATLINSFEEYNILFEADNGKEFLNQLNKKNPPDIVLLDITMPVMNGYETAEWIRTNLPDTKILVLSMMDNDAAIIRMLRYGAKGYILKDSKPQVFKQALNSVRDNGFYLNDLISSKMLHYVNANNKKDTSLDPAISLSDRELTFLRHACTEKTHKEIAEEMCVSHRTVDSYRDTLFEKLGVTSRVGLVLFAIRNGIVSV